MLIYLTARDRARGEEAVRQLQADPAVAEAKALASHGGQTTIAFHELDISRTESIGAFVEALKEKHPEGVDFVINNAAIAMQGFGES